ncbi:uncharacterized protein SCHCODRAFT_02491081, partial [Schizophyllum commune H4-8]|uniref:uncharacterized protein n=1 Tax=Schizophyllum commune (strain H4-8 / FGSC 9210) TaxID=578458 RepID=UPI00215F45C2
SHGPTVPRSHDPTIPRSHGPTVPRFHGPTIPRSHDPTVPRSHGRLVPGLLPPSSKCEKRKGVVRAPARALRGASTSSLVLAQPQAWLSSVANARSSVEGRDNTQRVRRPHAAGTCDCPALGGSLRHERS